MRCRLQTVAEEKGRANRVEVMTVVGKTRRLIVETHNLTGMVNLAYRPLHPLILQCLMEFRNLKAIPRLLKKTMLRQVVFGASFSKSGFLTSRETFSFFK